MTERSQKTNPGGDIEAIFLDTDNPDESLRAYLDKVGMPMREQDSWIHGFKAKLRELELQAFRKRMTGQSRSH